MLCVAEDAGALDDLRRATVSADWELAPGATAEDEAMRQLHAERPHVLVVFGPFSGLIERAVEAYPFLRVISDRPAPGAEVVVASVGEVRGAVKRPPAGGPVRS